MAISERQTPGPPRTDQVGRSTLVTRQRVLDAVLSSSAPAVCLAAPSGYGKSTVLRQWAQLDERPVVITHAHPDITDPHLVAERVLEAVVSAGLVARGIVLPEARDLMDWHATLIPGVGRVAASLPEPIVLAVDEVTALEGPEWDALVACLLDSLPSGSALCLVTRAETPKVFRLRRGTERVLELGAESLAMDAVEAAELLRSLGARLSDAQFLDFLERTEGWPALVYLGGLAVRDGRGVPSSPGASYGVVADYIRDGIFARLDPETTDFLLRTSVLTELTGGLCEAVTGDPGSLGTLRQLASTYHVVVPLDSAGSRFRLHHLLADFAVSELRARSLEDWRSAHRAASVALEASGDVDGAVHHATLAEDDGRLSSLIWEHAGSLLGSGRVRVLRRWIDAIDSERIRASPRLAVAAAWVAQHTGDLDAMKHLCAAAERACESADRESADCGDVYPYVCVLKVSMALDGVEAMARLATECLETLPAGDVWRTPAHFHRGVGLLLAGDLDAAAVDLEAARQLALAHRIPVMQGLALSSLVVAAAMADDAAATSSWLGELRSTVSRHPMDSVAVAAPIYASAAFGNAREGRTADARLDAATALRLTSMLRGMAPWYAVLGRLLLTDVFLSLGNLAQAATLLHEAELEAGPSSRTSVIDALLQQTRDAVERAGAVDVGPEQLSLAEIRVLQYLPTHMSFREIAADLYVSRSTVKTQALSAYRKLSVHSRGEAVDKGRALGLIPGA